MKIFAFLSFILLAHMGSAQQQAMMRVLEAVNKGDSYILLTYGTGASEKIDLSGLGMTVSSSRLEENQKVIMNLLQRLRNEGFRMIELSHTGTSGYSSTIMIFEMRE